jgi:hypothetical protein
LSVAAGVRVESENRRHRCALAGALLRRAGVVTVEAELDKQADPGSDLSSEKKQKILSQIRIVADRWRPFLMEASSAISRKPKQPAKKWRSTANLARHVASQLRHVFSYACP